MCMQSVVALRCVLRKPQGFWTLRELISRTRRRTTKVEYIAFWDPPSGSNNMFANLDILAEFRSRLRRRDTLAISIRPTCSQDCRRSDTACRTRSLPSYTTCDRQVALPDVDISSLHTYMYRVVQKQPPVTTPSNIYRFSKFFHWHTQQEICSSSNISNASYIML